MVIKFRFKWFYKSEYSQKSFNRLVLSFTRYLGLFLCLWSSCLTKRSFKIYRNKNIHLKYFRLFGNILASHQSFFICDLSATLFRTHNFQWIILWIAQNYHSALNWDMLRISFYKLWNVFRLDLYWKPFHFSRFFIVLRLCFLLKKNFFKTINGLRMPRSYQIWIFSRLSQNVN